MVKNLHKMTRNAMHRQECGIPYRAWRGERPGNLRLNEPKSLTREPVKIKASDGAMLFVIGLIVGTVTTIVAYG